MVVCKCIKTYLFYFTGKGKKREKEGFIPIYCRVTIDGLEDERSRGVKVLDHQLDNDAKQVLSTNPFYKAYDKKLGQMIWQLNYKVCKFTFLRVNYHTQ